MNVKQARNSALLLITAFIWGVAFVAQTEGGDAIGPISFNGIRSLIGAAVLVPVILVMEQANRKKIHEISPEQKKIDRRNLLLGGVLCGCALFLATTSQQLGITMGTGTGKAGFLTTCYILIVPILGLFFKKTCGWNIWVGCFLTLIGLGLLCLSDSLTFQTSDLLILLCAFLFSIQILLVDHFSPLVSGVKLACLEFFVCGLLSLPCMFMFEMDHSIDGFLQWLPQLAAPAAWFSLFYAGVLSCGVAYTLQIIAQDGLNPTIASLIMSLESVFSALAGWVLLHQTLGARELAGCAIIFVAVVLAQLPVTKRDAASQA